MQLNQTFDLRVSIRYVFYDFSLKSIFTVANGEMKKIKLKEPVNTQISRLFFILMKALSFPVTLTRLRILRGLEKTLQRIKHLNLNVYKRCVLTRRRAEITFTTEMYEDCLLSVTRGILK